MERLNCDCSWLRIAMWGAAAQWVRWSADAAGKGDGGLLSASMPTPTLPPTAASASKDRGGEGWSDGKMVGIRSSGTTTLFATLRWPRG